MSNKMVRTEHLTRKRHSRCTCMHHFWIYVGLRELAATPTLCKRPCRCVPASGRLHNDRVYIGFLEASLAAKSANALLLYDNKAFPYSVYLHFASLLAFWCSFSPAFSLAAGLQLSVFSQPSPQQTAYIAAHKSIRCVSAHAQATQAGPPRTA